MKKMIKTCALILNVCFVLLGVVFKTTANSHQGVKATTGVIINGEYSQTMSGQLGKNQEKYDAFNRGSKIFFTLAGVMGIVFVVTLISKEE